MPTPLCVYVKFDGVQCGSPALRGKVFCYHHARSRTARQSNIIIPPPDSPAACMYTLHALTQLLLNAKITVQEYRAVVHGFRVTGTYMKMAAQNSDQPRVTDVSRHVSADIAFAGPDADPQEENVDVGARLASPAAVQHDFSRATAPTEPAALAAAVLDPPAKLERNNKATTLAASISHAGLADTLPLDPRLAENAKIEPRPQEFKFKPRPLTQEEIDNPYVRPTSDALADYLNRTYGKRRGHFG